MIAITASQCKHLGIGIAILHCQHTFSLINVLQSDQLLQSFSAAVHSQRSAGPTAIVSLGIAIFQFALTYTRGSGSSVQILWISHSQCIAQHSILKNTNTLLAWTVFTAKLQNFFWPTLGSIYTLLGYLGYPGYPTRSTEWVGPKQYFSQMTGKS